MIVVVVVWCFCSLCVGEVGELDTYLWGNEGGEDG